MSEYTLADIKTGKVRSATFTQHGFSLDFFDQPGKNSHLTGTHLNPVEKAALVEYGVPCFHYEKNDAINMPIIRGYDFEHLPWSSISRVTPEIGHSLLSLTADRVDNFEPIKIPLALFTTEFQKRLLETAEKTGKQHMLIDLPIESSQNFYQQPDKYYKEVIADLVPPALKNLADGIFHQMDDIKNKLGLLEHNPNELEATELFSAKKALQKQQDLLKSHISKINESILIGKANDWTPKQTMEHAQASIKHLNAGIKREIKAAQRESNPVDAARTEICNKIDSFIDKIFRSLSENMRFSI